MLDSLVFIEHCKWWQKCIFCLKAVSFVLFSSSIHFPNSSFLQSFTVMRNGQLPILLPEGHSCFLKQNVRKGNSLDFWTKFGRKQSKSKTKNEHNPPKKPHQPKKKKKPAKNQTKTPNPWTKGIFIVLTSFSNLLSHGRPLSSWKSFMLLTHNPPYICFSYWKMYFWRRLLGFLTTLACYKTCHLILSVALEFVAISTIRKVSFKGIKIIKSLHWKRITLNYPNNLRKAFGSTENLSLPEIKPNKTSPNMS